MARLPPPGPSTGGAPGASSNPRTVAGPPRSHGPNSPDRSPNNSVWLIPSVTRSNGVAASYRKHPARDGSAAAAASAPNPPTPT